MMKKIVGIRFKPVTKVYYFDPGLLDNLQIDDWVIVETMRGTELGHVALAEREVPDNEIKGELKQVVRPATPVDLLMAQEYKAREPEAMTICQRLVKKLNIPMKTIQAAYSFDGSRLLFTFTAEQRVDFRDLVKELAKSLRTRIEMKQVGARDQAKLIDGYGRCGRQLCCSSWLTEFHPVSIRMAKHQGLPLAPAEISGVCGRLLCCLAYEDELYVEMRANLPKVGHRVKLKEGEEGVIRGLNVLLQRVIVQLDEGGGYTEIEVEQIEEVKPKSASRSKAKPKATPPKLGKPEEESNPKAAPKFKSKSKAKARSAAKADEKPKSQRRSRRSRKNR